MAVPVYWLARRASPLPLSRPALLAALIGVFLILPALVLPRVHNAVFLLLGWEAVLAAYLAEDTKREMKLEGAEGALLTELRYWRGGRRFLVAVDVLEDQREVVQQLGDLELLEGPARLRDEQRVAGG